MNTPQPSRASQPTVDPPTPQPNVQAGETGELGSEGGSYSELTQRERVRAESASAEPPPAGSSVMRRLVWWTVCLAVLASLLWFVVHMQAI